jgi:REP element-mobilizing transposase RayT
MQYNPDIHHRRSIRLKDYDYSQSGMYFITVCVHNYQCLFGIITDGEMILNEYGKIVDDEWQYLKTKYPHIELYEYVIMPNHFHGIVAITVENIIGYFKYQTTKKIDMSVKLWQRNYWERIIRTQKSHQYVVNYIANNPARWANDEFFNQ